MDYSFYSVDLIDDWNVCEDDFMKAPDLKKGKVDRDFLHETLTMSLLENDDQISVGSNTSRTSGASFDSFEESKFQQLSDDRGDCDYIVFPLSLEKADSVCVRLNQLIQSGRIPKHRIMYKYLSDVTNIITQPQLGV